MSRRPPPYFIRSQRFKYIFMWRIQLVQPSRYLLVCGGASLGLLPMVVLLVVIEPLSVVPVVVVVAYVSEVTRSRHIRKQKSSTRVKKNYIVFSLSTLQPGVAIEIADLTVIN